MFAHSASTTVHTGSEGAVKDFLVLIGQEHRVDVCDRGALEFKVLTAQDKEKGVYVAGAKKHPVETEDKLLQVMQVGISKLAPQTTAQGQTFICS